MRGAAPAHATEVAENKSTRTLVGLAIPTGYLYLATIGTVVVRLALGRPEGVIGNLLPVATHILIHYVLPFVAFNAIGVALCFSFSGSALPPTTLRPSSTSSTVGRANSI